MQWWRRTQGLVWVVSCFPMTTVVSAAAHRAHQSKDFLGKSQGFFWLRKSGSSGPTVPSWLRVTFGASTSEWQLRGIRYNSPQEAVEALVKVLEEWLFRSGRAASPSGFTERTTRGIEAKGEYFEKL